MDHEALAYCGKNKLIRVPADMKGLKIRAPAPTMLTAITMWGGIPTSLDAPDVYDALSKGAIGER